MRVLAKEYCRSSCLRGERNLRGEKSIIPRSLCAQSLGWWRISWSKFIMIPHCENHHHSETRAHIDMTSRDVDRHHETYAQRWCPSSLSAYSDSCFSCLHSCGYGVRRLGEGTPLRTPMWDLKRSISDGPNELVAVAPENYMNVNMKDSMKVYKCDRLQS